MQKRSNQPRNMPWKQITIRMQNNIIWYIIKIQFSSLFVILLDEQSILLLLKNLLQYWLRLL